jgi:putative methyltransferase (TIGR04325 family)
MIDVSKKFYPSFDVALGACGNSGYLDEEIARVVVEKTAIRRRSIRELTYQVNVENDFRAIFVAGLITGKASFAVLDFGGGGGNYYNLVRSMISQSTKLKWVVVETKVMCEAAQKLATEELVFSHSITEADEVYGPFDLVFASGSVQYASDPEDVLKRLCNCRGRFIYITRTPMNDHISAVGVQSSMLSSNGPGPLPEMFTDKRVLYPIHYLTRKIYSGLCSRRYVLRSVVMEERASLFIPPNIPLNQNYGLFGEIRQC